MTTDKYWPEKNEQLAAQFFQASIWNCHPVWRMNLKTKCKGGVSPLFPKGALSH